MIFTQVTWPVARADFKLDAECKAKASEIGGSTVGSAVALEPKYIVQRGWADEATANQWIEFVNGLGAEAASIVAEPTPPTP
jgi:hypothetical protein